MDPTARLRRLAALLLAAGVVATCCAASAMAEAQDGAGGATATDTTPPDRVIDEEAIVAPRAPVEGTRQTVGDPPPQQEPVDPGQDQGDPAQPRIALGNAAFQKPVARRAEAQRACASAKRPATSPMLGTSGEIVVDGARNRGLLLLVPAAGIALFALVLAIRRRRSQHDTRSHDPLERIATLVAIAAGLAGVVVQFAPGVAVAEHPPREAAMKVREVHPRITRREYADKLGASVRLSKTDGREVGNVIWLELNLRGYEGTAPVLQYGLYDEDRGEVLLPNTAKETRLAVQQGDEQTSFVPIWVGYPTPNKFRAQFRLLDRGQVQEMARTGTMKGSAFRYACTRA